MDIASKETHRALVYLSAATRNGKPIPVELFDMYAKHPEPRAAKFRTVGGDALLMVNDWSTFVQGTLGTRELVTPAETMSAYLVRVGWADISNDGVSLTPLGNSVLQALNSPVVDVSDEDPITVVIDPSDRLAYAKVFGLIVTRDAGLIVDAYLGVPEFFELVELPAVTRILMSDRDVNHKRGTIAQALAALDGRVAVRYIAAKRLHDRFFIPDEGDVLVFGSSLNSITRRPGVVTPLADSIASSAIRSAYEQLWDDATPIEPAKSKRKPSEGAANS